MELGEPDPAPHPEIRNSSLFNSRDFFVITSFDEARVTSRLFANNPERDVILNGLENVDYEQSFEIVVWHGVAPDIRFTLDIKRIIQQGATLRVVVEAYNRCNRFPVVLLACPYTPVETYPMRILSVSYSDLPESGFYTIEFVVNGTVEKTIRRVLPPESE